MEKRKSRREREWEADLKFRRSLAPTVTLFTGGLRICLPEHVYDIDFKTEKLTALTHEEALEDALSSRRGVKLSL